MQVDPVINAIRKKQVDCKIIVSFFSPSGMNNVKNKNIDCKVYIPFDFYWSVNKALNIVKPISTKLTKVEFKTYIWDESKLELGAGSILDKVEREDEDIVEQVQKGVSSRFYKHGRYSPRMEKGVHHFHTLIFDFLNQV